MPTCKLCREDRELQESHFLPAAVYAQLREPAQSNPNPVLVTSQISQTTSKQITDRVLCADCEQRFSRLGESWVLANMFRREGFAIQEALLTASPIGANDSFAYYSAADIPAVNMNALVYFALSIFWRGSAHRWRNVSGIMEGIDLGPYEEAIRHFLLGEPFPKDTVVLVSVWPTKQVLPAAYTPRRGTAPGFHVHNFLIPGLEFRLATGKLIPDDFRRLCSYSSPEKYIFSAISIVSDTIDAFAGLGRTSRVSRGLQRAIVEKEKIV